MRIAFNLLNCGLGNNGGSQTIIRMAKELSKLNHDVKILLNQPNKFTWFEIPEDLLLYEGDITPEFDVMVATGCSTVESTLKYDKLPMDKKFYWIRAIEDWAMPLEKLIEGYKSGLKLIVNSEWQQKYIYFFKNKLPELVYSGVPIKRIQKEVEVVSENWAIINHSNINVGALASKKSRKRFEDVIDIAYKLNERKVLNKLILISNEGIDKLKKLFDFKKLDNINVEVIVQPELCDKIRAMRECDVWLSTTINEGLHIPPLEAGLCGCLLVSRDEYRSGVSDYCIHNETSLNYKNNDEAVEHIVRFSTMPKRERVSINRNLINIIHNKIGTVKDNAERMLKVMADEI